MTERSQKVVCVLFDDPSEGYPPKYVRDDLPKVLSYPDGQSLPSPTKVNFNQGDLLGCVSGELGLREFLEDLGHTLVVTSDKDGSDCAFQRELMDADIVISQPFWPGYLTADRMKQAPNLRLAITAGIGSDHVDLDAAMKHNVTVCEVTYSNSISVAEHAVMMILALVRNYIPQYQMVLAGGWDIADCVKKSYDLEGMNVGLVGAGRIGLAVMKRLRPFDVTLFYTDRYRLPEHVEKELNLTYFDSVEKLVEVCDVVSIHCPLYPQTENMFNAHLISKMKRGAYLINTARGKICETDAIKNALDSGKLAGYAGDVWFPQPAPSNHLWRNMPNHAMTPHTSGATLSAQARYAAGVREILECWFNGMPIRDEYLIVQGKQLAGVGAHSYSEGNSTGGVE